MGRIYRLSKKVSDKEASEILRKSENCLMLKMQNS